MAYEKEIKILEYKINDLNRKIQEFINHDISDKKTEKLRTLKLKYEAELKVYKP